MKCRRKLAFAGLPINQPSAWIPSGGNWMLCSLQHLCVCCLTIEEIWQIFNCSVRNKSKAQKTRAFPRPNKVPSGENLASHRICFADRIPIVFVSSPLLCAWTRSSKHDYVVHIVKAMIVIFFDQLYVEGYIVSLEVSKNYYESISCVAYINLH